MDLKGDSKMSSPELKLLRLLRESPELNRKLGGVENLLQLRGEPAWLFAPYKVMSARTTKHTKMTKKKERRSIKRSLDFDCLSCLFSSFSCVSWF